MPIEGVDSAHRVNHTRQTDPSKPRSRWRRPGLLIFWGLNLIGVVIAVPLLSAVYPLLNIWWNTRSQESVERYVERTKDTPPAATRTLSSTDPAIAGLTNQLKLIEGLSDDELSKIVAHQFGAKRTTASDLTQFDRDSAVFHQIQRHVRMINGKELVCYEIDLVDENGNHKTQMDCFEQPDPDYERSMATLQLVQSNPQLKKIYSAFAHVLADQSANPTNTNSSPSPAIRVEHPQK